MFTTSKAAKLEEFATVIVVDEEVMVVESVDTLWSTASGIVALVTTEPGNAWEKANPVNRRKDARRVDRVLTMAYCSILEFLSCSGFKFTFIKPKNR
jgi:hypothetical protein